MTSFLPRTFRQALIVAAGAAFTYCLLSGVDRLASHWTECGQWTACPANYLPAEMQP